MYIQFLHLSLSCLKPTSFQQPFAIGFQTSLEKTRATLLQRLSSIASQENDKFQNETALFYHFIRFFEDIDPIVLKNFQETTLFKQLNNSLMPVMNEELLTLKSKLISSNPEDSSDIWEKIIALEPALTITQRKMAGNHHYHLGSNATDPTLEIAHYTKAANYYEGIIKATRAMGQTPEADIYKIIAFALEATLQNYPYSIAENEEATLIKTIEYYEKYLEAVKTVGGIITADIYDFIAGFHCFLGKCEAGGDDSHTESIDEDSHAESIDEDSENYTPRTARKNYMFTKAIEYYEKGLEVKRAKGQTPSHKNYEAIADAYMGAMPVSIEYYEKRLKSIRAAGQIPTHDDYKRIAYDHSKTSIVHDPHITLTYPLKRADYCEKALEAISAAGKAPEWWEYRNLAEAYYAAGTFATDAHIKTATLTKACHYYEKSFEPEICTVADCCKAADAYFQLGISATDAHIKTANFTRAGQYFEKSWDRIIFGSYAYSDSMCQQAAEAYFQAGTFAADANTKQENFEKAFNYFKRAIAARACLYERDRIKEDVKGNGRLAEISTYFTNLGKSTFNNNLDEKSRGG